MKKLVLGLGSVAAVAAPVATVVACGSEGGVTAPETHADSSLLDFYYAITGGSASGDDIVDLVKQKVENAGHDKGTIKFKVFVDGNTNDAIYVNLDFSDKSKAEAIAREVVHLVITSGKPAISGLITNPSPAPAGTPTLAFKTVTIDFATGLTAHDSTEAVIHPPANLVTILNDLAKTTIEASEVKVGKVMQTQFTLPANTLHAHTPAQTVFVDVKLTAVGASPKAQVKITVNGMPGSPITKDDVTVTLT